MNLPAILEAAKEGGSDSGEGAVNAASEGVGVPADYFTLLFEGNLRKIDASPFHTDTPFGRPIAASLGDMFTENAELRDQVWALEDGVKPVPTGTITSRYEWHDGPVMEVRQGLVEEVKPFWFVWTKKGHVPKRCHDTRGSAEAEAERLARKCPGKKFIILEAVSKVHQPWPVWLPASDGAERVHDETEDFTPGLTKTPPSQGGGP